MKHLNYLWLASFAALASCSSDEYLGEQGGLAQNGGAKEISFASNTPNVTRANAEGETAANLLGRQFNVYGVKQDPTPATTYHQVFNNYSVYWAGTSALSTSNSKGWEYVTGASVVPATGTNGYQTGMSPAVSRKDVPANQSIKYWDYSAPDYWFYAVSAANETNEVFTWKNGSDENMTNLITTKVAKCVITNIAENNSVFYADAVQKQHGGSGDKVYADKPASSQTDDEVVKFTFKRLGAKVRIGLYETIPGYSVSDVKFYGAATTLTDNTEVGFSSTNGTDATLVTSTKASGTPDASIRKGFMPTSGNEYTISYDGSDGTATLKNTTSTLVLESSKTFGSLAPTTLGITSTAPSWAGSSSTDNYYHVVLPNEDEDQYDGFKIMVDYKLTSTDGSGEEINVKHATAYVPSNYCQWKPNTAYTYLFKISDNTNGSTGTPGTDPSGLYPI